MSEKVIRKATKMTTKEYREFVAKLKIETLRLDIDTEKCLMLMQERQAKTNLNRMIRQNIKTTVIKNGKNEDIFLKYIAMLLRGATDGQDFSDGRYAMTRWDSDNKVGYVECEYKENMIRAIVSNEQITLWAMDGDCEPWEKLEELCNKSINR